MLSLFRRNPAPAAPAVFPAARFRPAAHVSAAAQGGRTVLLDQRAGEYIGLDEVGTRIWELLGEGRDLSGVADALEAEYDAPRHVLERDVAAVAAKLATLGVLQSCA